MNKLKVYFSKSNNGEYPAYNAVHSILKLLVDADKIEVLEYAKSDGAYDNVKLSTADVCVIVPPILEKNGYNTDQMAVGRGQYEQALCCLDKGIETVVVTFLDPGIGSHVRKLESTEILDNDWKYEYGYLDLVLDDKPLTYVLQAALREWELKQGIKNIRMRKQYHDEHYIKYIYRQMKAHSGMTKTEIIAYVNENNLSNDSNADPVVALGLAMQFPLRRKTMDTVDVVRKHIDRMHGIYMQKSGRVTRNPETGQFQSAVDPFEEPDIYEYDRNQRILDEIEDSVKPEYRKLLLLSAK